MFIYVVHQHSVYTCTTPVQEAVAQGFEIELERFGTPDCYFNSLPAELDVKRKMIAKMLEIESNQGKIMTDLGPLYLEHFII